MSLYKALGGLPPQAAGPAASGSPDPAAGPQLPSLYQGLQQPDLSTQPLQLGPMVAQNDLANAFAQTKAQGGVPVSDVFRGGRSGPVPSKMDIHTPQQMAEPMKHQKGSVESPYNAFARQAKDPNRSGY